MGRKASVKYWTSRGAYCCEYQGKQHTLAVGERDEPHGANYTAAVAAFARLVCGTGGLTLREVADRYLAGIVDLEPETIRIRRQRLDAVCEELGGQPVSSLTSLMLEDLCRRRRREARRNPHTGCLTTWGDATVTTTLSSVKACLRWAADKGVIEKFPLGKLDMPGDVSRSDECLLTAEQQERILAACRRQTLRDFVCCLQLTGARPSEISRAEARYFDSSINALVYPAKTRRGEKTHKTAKKTGKARIIYLHGEALEIVLRLIKLYPSGPLFRTGRKKAKGAHKGENWGWSAHDICLAMRRLRVKAGVPNLVAYSFRHSYAVAWCRARKPIEALAIVMCSSIKTLMLHYAHWMTAHDYLRSLIEE